MLRDKEELRWLGMTHGRFKIVLSSSPSDDQQLYGFAHS